MELDFEWFSPLRCAVIVVGPLCNASCTFSCGHFIISCWISSSSTFQYFGGYNNSLRCIENKSSQNGQNINALFVSRRGHRVEILKSGRVMVSDAFLPIESSCLRCPLFSAGKCTQCVHRNPSRPAKHQDQYLITHCIIRK